MPRNYKRKLGARSFKDFTDENLKKAVKACRDEGLSIREACGLHGFKRETLHNEKAKKANGTKKATSKTITCENESSEDDTDESDIESIESSLMVRKFDFILYKIWGKENHFSFGFNKSRSKITLNQALQN